MKEKLHERLQMRALTTDDTAQYNALLRYAFQVTDSELASLGWNQKEMERSKKPVLKKTESYGWFDGEKLASQISIYPMQVNIFGQMYKMGGVTGVATYPEYMNLGLMSSLIKTALNSMRENHQCVSMLVPYMIPYYRKKGWEIVTDKMTYTIKDTQLPKRREVSGMVERVGIDSEDLRIVHNAFTRMRHGALKRNELEWEEYWRWEADDVIVAVYYNEAGEPKGYLVYYIANDVFRIKELVYINQEARHGLWNYVSAHFSMIDKVVGTNYTNEPMAFLLEDSEIQEEIEPNVMARIVDFEAFIKKYPFDIISIHDDLHFIIHDPVMECNCGDFSLRWDKQGNTIIERGGTRGERVECDIQTLTAMFYGYKRPTYLKRVERLDASDDAVRILEDIIPIEQPYFSDYF
ncbi:MAG: GNAT family N-acetyltransferase [Clostridiales bacterium]|nr:GNAT family N-acetyltransferase [Clostridiales bacterium]MCI6587920.1 GNAT family N-acetyltransferase [Clostridiales bacterium]MCI7705275.1 GNAT family N-acetyltransferase [Clostridiales bacterium]MDY4541498.1 GNAT family N-acetyltransferase [Candidatus Ventricola sp.]